MRTAWDPLHLFILCGGKATRLRGVNKGCPKAMLRVGDMSLLSTLVLNLGPHVDSVAFGCSSDIEPFIGQLRNEIGASFFDRIHLEMDRKQLGTGMAVQNFAKRKSGPLLVINGDTLFEKYENLIPQALDSSGVSFSVSRQSATRSSILRRSESSDLFEITKHREGKSKASKIVLNGAIALGEAAVEMFVHEKLKVAEPVEDIALGLQNKGAKISTYDSCSRFVDFGTPEEFSDPISAIKKQFS